jgi:hypothetical protein
MPETPTGDLCGEDMEQPDPTPQEIEALTSIDTFNKRYHKVLVELDSLYKGMFDETEADCAAALCLLSQAALVQVLASAEFKARSLKRDIDFAKAEAYSTIKADPPDGKKVTEAALTQLITKDPEVQRLSRDQNLAEKEAKELSNILSILKDAHITFRSIHKKGV